MQTSRNCFHCGESAPDSPALTVKAGGEERSFCCHGCKAVSELIESEGLDRFYHHRTAPSPKPRELAPHEQARLRELDHELLQQSFVQPEKNGHRRAYLMITGLSCAACIWLIEHHLEKIPGVQQILINHSTQRATLTWNADQIALSEVLLAISQLGFEARPFRQNEFEEQLHKQQRQALIRLCVAGVGMMQSMMLAIPLYFGIISGISETQFVFFRWVSMLVATPVILYSAQPFFRAGWRDLRSRYLTMDVPVALGIGIAYLSSVWITLTGGEEVYFDAVCMFTFFLSLGRFMENRARIRAGLAGSDLAGSLPTAARREIDGSEELVAAELVALGDVIRVRPGETIPVDGEIIGGRSQIDEAALTGEYMPVTRGLGDQVIAGTVNGSGPLRVRVMRTSGQTRLSAITQILDQAQAEKPRTAELADQAARYFVTAVLLVSAGAYFGWRAAGAEDAFAIMLSVLVVTCPCALSLATPTALTAATTTLRRKGFLPARGYTLEALATVDTLVFDKTGTLTQGALKLIRTETAAQVSEQLALAWAAALENHSEHPIARAFPDRSSYRADDVQNHLGQGLSGTIDNRRLYLGSADFMNRELGVSVPEPEAATGVIVHVCDADGWLASFYWDDRPRSDAAETITLLKGMGLGVALLSGDKQAHVQRVAQELGIDQAWGEAQPEDKLSRLRQLEQSGRRVAVVGDGLNDLPAMAGARLSIAMGAANDLTQIRADGILLAGQLIALPSSIVTARKARSIIRQNMAWALAYNIVALPAALAGLVPPWLAAIGMSLSSLIVVLNAMRLGQENSRPDPQTTKAEPAPHLTAAH